MKRNLRLHRDYPHPPELVWRALTDRELIAEWLMDNDFTPVLGHRFNFRMAPQPGFDGIVHCEVLALDEPRSMRWSWRGGPIDTEVSFHLVPRTVAGRPGTRLEIAHTGFDGFRAVLVSFIMGSGNRSVYGKRLPAVLDRLAAGRERDAAPAEGRKRKPMRRTWQLLAKLFAPILRRGERKDRRARR
jgi:uncharacterized protein YndB with AHSA1/START domain